MTVWAYYRVSTEKQDFESQKIGVVDYAKKHGYEIDREIIDDGVSGTVKAADRKLNVILKQMKAGDVIITGELSRLGRSAADVINTCNKIAERGVNCYLVKQGMKIDKTPMGKMLIAIMGAFAEMERDLIRQRTIEGLARVKASGRKLGRAYGSCNKQKKLDGKEFEITELYNAGYSNRAIAAKLNVSSTEINRKIKEMGIYMPNRVSHIRNVKTAEEKKLERQQKELEIQQKRIAEEQKALKVKVRKIKGGYVCGNVRIFCD